MYSSVETTKYHGNKEKKKIGLINNRCNMGQVKN